FSRRRTITQMLVFDNMRREFLTEFTPPFPVERAVNIEALDRRVGHGERMMSIIMSKQSLPAERQHALQARRPAVESLELLLISGSINRISMRQSPRHHANRARR